MQRNNDNLTPIPTEPSATKLQNFASHELGTEVANRGTQNSTSTFSRLLNALKIPPSRSFPQWTLKAVYYTSSVILLITVLCSIFGFSAMLFEEQFSGYQDESGTWIEMSEKGHYDSIVKEWVSISDSIFRITVMSAILIGFCLMVTAIFWALARHYHKPRHN